MNLWNQSNLKIGYTKNYSKWGSKDWKGGIPINTKRLLKAVIRDWGFKLNLKKIFYLVIILSIPLGLLYSDLLIKVLSTIKACSKIERNLEIARPYITNEEYLLLRSNYRLIDDKKKLADLIKQLEKIGVEKKLDLPEIELLGL